MRYVARKDETGTYVTPIPDDNAKVIVGKGARLYKSWDALKKAYPDAEKPEE